jgi:hypothetical protein
LTKAALLCVAETHSSPDRAFGSTMAMALLTRTTGKTKTATTAVKTAE